jgi:RNA polymerase sigma factor (sigma-70 family)
VTAKELNSLFAQARTGDSTAEKRLFEYLSERFRQFARHRIWDPMDADEVVQETIMTICREYRSLEITASISAWAYKVLDYRILTHVQAQQTKCRRTATDPLALETIPAVSPHLELRRRLIDCLRKICVTNRRYARVLNLHSQGYETPEICKRLELRENSMYSLLHRSRAMLRRCLETGAID